jgi:hypothetical protein
MGNISSVNSSQLSNQPHRFELTDKLNALKDLKNQLKSATEDSKFLNTITRILDQIDSFSKTKNRLPTQPLLSSIMTAIETIERLDIEFIEDQLDSLSDNKKKRRKKLSQHIQDNTRYIAPPASVSTTAYEGIQPIKKIKEINGYSLNLEKSSDLGALTAIALALNEAPALLTPLDNSQKSRIIGGYIIRDQDNGIYVNGCYIETNARSTSEVLHDIESEMKEEDKTIAVDQGNGISVNGYYIETKGHSTLGISTAIEIALNEAPGSFSPSGSNQKPMPIGGTITLDQDNGIYVNGYPIETKGYSALGILAEINIALNKAPLSLSPSKNNPSFKPIDGHRPDLVPSDLSNDALIAMIKGLLENGISGLDELTDILQLVGALGLNIPLTLLNRLTEEITLFIETEAQNTPTFSEFMIMFQVIQSIANSEIGEHLFDRLQLDSLLSTPASSSIRQPPSFNIEPIAIDSEINSDINSQSEPVPVTFSDPGPKSESGVVNPIGQVIKPSVSAITNDPNNESLSKVLSVNEMEQLDQKYAAIGKQLTEWIEKNKLLFLDQLLDTLTPYVQSLIVDALDPLTQSL